MEKLKKFFINMMIVAYAVVAISVTILLLSYNEYHCSVVGDYTFVLVQDDELEEYGYDEGSLVLVKETKAKNINPGDEIFLYRQITTTQFEIKYAEVLMKDESKGEYDVSYVLEGGIVVDHNNVIGSTKDIKVVPHLGTILSILQSRYGYLFLIVVVSFIAFLYEIYELIMEIKYGEREDEEDYEDDEDDDEYYDEDEEEEEVVVKPKKATAKKTTATKTSTAKKAVSAKTTSTKKSTTTKAKSTTKKSGTTAKKTTAAKTSTAKKSATAKSK